MTSTRPHRQAALALLALTLLSNCAKSADASSSDDAARLARIVAAQRAQPAEKPAVHDRVGLTAGVTEAWRWASPDKGDLGLPAADDAGVVVTHTGQNLVAFDPSGARQWSVEHAGLRPVEPLLTGELVITAGEDDVMAVDRGTGAPRWVTAIGHERANAPTLATQNTIVVTTWEGRLVALDRASGVVRWSATLDAPSLSRPAALDGLVVAAWDGGWGAFDASDGRLRWKAELFPEGASAPAVVSLSDAKAVGIVASGGRIDALDLRTGAQQWSSTTWVDSSVDHGIAVLGGPRPKVGVPDRDGGVTVLDAASGALQWFREGGEDDLAERAEPVPAGDGVLAYALDWGGIRFAWAGGEQDFDPGGPVTGLARAGGRLIATTWHTEAPALIGFDVLTRVPNR